MVTGKVQEELILRPLLHLVTSTILLTNKVIRTLTTKRGMILSLRAVGILVILREITMLISA
jgi:hypothetical protein